jgi:hypothetical protein
MSYKYDTTKILDLTNGGLDVILHLYPDADKVGGKWGKVILNFENENTPSSCIVAKTVGTDCVVLKSFSTGKSFNCFQLVQAEFGLEFYESCKWINDNLHLDLGDNTNFGNAGFEMKEAEPGQKHGEYIFEYNKEFSEFELDTLGKLVKDEHCTPFRLLSCKQFTQIKEYPKDLKQHKSEKTHQYAGKTMQIITKSSETYPIFVFEYGSWQKIYQPLNADKSYRFRYAGDKPENYVFGLDVVEAKFKENQKKIEKKIAEAQKNDEKLSEKDTDPRLDQIIIGSGDRDSINIKSMGFDVVWLNSETAVVDYKLRKKLYKYAKRISYCGDIDATGVEQSIKTALQNIDIHVVWLPEKLKEYKYRGKARKDVKDFVDIFYKKDSPDYVKNYFSKLVWQSVPTKFWFEIKGRKNFDLSMEALMRFYWYHGFYRFQEENAKKDDYTFIKLENNVVYDSDTTTLQNFPIQWLKDKLYPIKLIDYMHTTAKLNKDKLKRLPVYQPRYDHTGKDFQYQFYKNKIWKITPKEIFQIPYGKADTDVHESKIIQRDAYVQKKKYFKIFTNDKGNIDIKIVRTDNDFFNFIINTSRLHWAENGLKPFKERIKKLKAEIEDEEKLKEETEKVIQEMKAYRKKYQHCINEPGLTEQQKYEQRLSLINKLYAYGYMLHRHKEASRAFAPLIMDNKISESSQDSNGGSGKSILFVKAIQNAVGFENVVEIDGSKPDINKDKFIFDEVNKYKHAVVFNDIEPYFRMRIIYNCTTDGFKVEVKGLSKYSIPNEESPKVCTISNFGLPDYENSGSTKRRILPVPFSDYYHAQTRDDLDKHEPLNEFDKQFFQDWNEEDFNDFYNFNAQCVQFKMNQSEPVQAISENIQKRNQQSAMGTFQFWADQYFTIDNLNTFIPMNKLRDDYSKENSKLSSQKINKKLQDWCDFKGFEFNPEEYKDTSGYIKKRIGDDNFMQTCLYIRTPKNYLEQYEANKADIEDSNYPAGDNPFIPEEDLNDID